jgi:hypothetical protein
MAGQRTQRGPANRQIKSPVETPGFLFSSVIPAKAGIQLPVLPKLQAGCPLSRE